MTEDTAPRAREASAQAPTLEPPAAEKDPHAPTASTARLAAIVLMLALIGEIVPFQYTMAGLITPLVGRSFPSAGNSVSWMVTIIGLVGGGTIAVVARMADLWGRKRMLLVCSLLFLAGSILCALTDSWALFLVGRGCEATALGMSALCYTLIRDLMPRSWIPVSVGFIGTGTGLSAVCGPLIGGVLTDHYSWRSIFWFLAIYVAVVLPLFLLIVPESPLRIRQRLDIPGATLVGLGMAGMLLYISEGQSWGWGNPTCYLYMIGGVLAFALFVAWENHAVDPIMDLSVLRDSRMVLILLMSFFATGVMGVLNFAGPYMFLTDGNMVRHSIIAAGAQQAHVPPQVVARFITFHGDISYAHGLSLMEFALRIALFSSVTAMIFGPVGGMWARKYGPAQSIVACAVLFLIATSGLVVWHDTWQSQALFSVIWGAALGLLLVGLSNLLIRTVTPERQSVSAGLQSAFGAVGTSAAVALSTSVLVRHPFQIVATTSTGRMVTNVPQVYTNGGFGQVYLIVGVGGSVIALLIALAIWARQSSTAV